MNEVSIRVISRLESAPVTDWVNIVRQLEAERRAAFLMFKPVRKAIVEVTAHRDQLASIRASLIRQTIRLRNNGYMYNLAAFDTYVEAFLPLIKSLDRDLMSAEYGRTPASLAGVSLIGGPQMEVTDMHGRRKYIYLRPGKTWPSDEVTAYCEMLCVVLEQRYDAKPSDLWFLDLHNAERVSYPRSKKAVRRRCTRAIELLARLLDSGGFDKAA